MERGPGIWLNINSVVFPPQANQTSEMSVDTRRMWRDLQAITDYKKKTCHVTDTDAFLSDKLNTFFARFEDNTVPLTRAPPLLFRGRCE